jgi:hypothetical protein
MAPQDDLHFVCEQARRFVSARPWDRLAPGSYDIFECLSKAN